MKFSVNDIELFTLSETQKSVIKNDISSEIFEEDMKRKVQYIIMHKYEQCFKQLKAEWEPKLIAQGATTLPTDKAAFATLVFAHKDYKNRSAKELEAKETE